MSAGVATLTTLPLPHNAQNVSSNPWPGGGIMDANLYKFFTLVAKKDVITLITNLLEPTMPTVVCSIITDYLPDLERYFKFQLDPRTMSTNWRNNQLVSTWSSIFHPMLETCTVPTLTVVDDGDDDDDDDDTKIKPQPWQKTTAETLHKLQVYHTDKLAKIHKMPFVFNGESYTMYYRLDGVCCMYKGEHEEPKTTVDVGYTIPGAVLYESTGVGKTFCSVLSMRQWAENKFNNNGSSSSSSKHAVMVCIVPPATFTDWKETIKLVWSDVHLRCCSKTSDLKVLLDTTTDGHTIYLINKKVFFKGTTNTASPHIQFETYQSMGQNDDAFKLFPFFSQDISFLLLDEAHEYMIPSKKEMKNDTVDTFSVTRVAYTIRRWFINVGFTLCVTATPDLSKRGLNQLMFLLGASHTNKFDTRTLPQYHKDTCGQRLLIHYFHTSTSLNEGRWHLMNNHILTTATKITRAVRTMVVTFTDHLLFCIKNRDLYVIRRTSRLPDRNGVDNVYMDQIMNNTVHNRVRFNHIIQHIESNRSFNTPTYGKLTTSNRLLDPLVRSANSATITAPLYPFETAFVRMVIGCVSDNNNRVLVYVGNVYGVTRDSMMEHLKEALHHHTITLDNFQGQHATLDKKRRIFLQQGTTKHVMMIGKHHLAGMNIPECTHILIAGKVIDETGMTQLVGRARRYCAKITHTPPLQVVYLQPKYDDRWLV
jgi:hypothetical protein